MVTYITGAKLARREWFMENLRATRYNDGTSIPCVEDNNECLLSQHPHYCWYDNNAAANKSIYGALYNWYAVSTDKLCPLGWHMGYRDRLDNIDRFSWWPRRSRRSPERAHN